MLLSLLGIWNGWRSLTYVAAFVLLMAWERYLLGYMPEQSKIYLIDKELNVVDLPTSRNIPEKSLKQWISKCNDNVYKFFSTAGHAFHPPHGLDRVPVCCDAQGGNNYHESEHGRQAKMALNSRKRGKMQQFITKSGRILQLQRPFLLSCQSLELKDNKTESLITSLVWEILWLLTAGNACARMSLEYGEHFVSWRKSRSLHNRIARFLENQGYQAEALQISKDLGLLELLWTLKFLDRHAHSVIAQWSIIL